MARRDMVVVMVAMIGELPKNERHYWQQRRRAMRADSLMVESSWRKGNENAGHRLE